VSDCSCRADGGASHPRPLVRLRVSRLRLAYVQAFMRARFGRL